MHEHRTFLIALWLFSTAWSTLSREHFQWQTYPPAIQTLGSGELGSVAVAWCRCHHSGVGNCFAQSFALCEFTMDRERAEFAGHSAL